MHELDLRAREELGAWGRGGFSLIDGARFLCGVWFVCLSSVSRSTLYWAGVGSRAPFHLIRPFDNRIAAWNHRAAHAQTTISRQNSNAPITSPLDPEGARAFLHLFHFIIATISKLIDYQ